MPHPILQPFKSLRLNESPEDRTSKISNTDIDLAYLPPLSLAVKITSSLRAYKHHRVVKIIHARLLLLPFISSVPAGNDGIALI